MDATKRPIKISPNLVNYAEKHKIFENMKNLLELLIIDRPQNPIAYLIDYLKKEIDEVPRIFILGGPNSGKHTLAKILSGRLKCISLGYENIFSQCDNDINNIAEDCFKTGRAIPENIWTKALRFRTKLFDCEKNGWMLCGFPESREQAYSIQCEGIFPTHVVLLTSPDYVLIERAQGKRIDPQTGDIYHMVFDPAPDNDVKERLVTPPGCSEEDMKNRLTCYNRNIALVKPLYQHVLKEINSDQPIADVFQTALDFCMTLPRLPALRTPRIVLLGSPGAGKSTIASLIAKKYSIMKIHCGELIRQAIADGNKHGMAMRSYVDKNVPVPDSILIQLIEEKLSDLCCSTYGWVLLGYPQTVKQAEELDCVKLQPNRVFFLEVPPFMSLERVCERRLDPITGDRYHNSYNPSTNAQVSKRLVLHPEDNVKVIKHKISHYNTISLDLKAYYNDHVVIDANNDLHNVFELVESYLVNPLPRRLE